MKNFLCTFINIVFFLCILGCWVIHPSSLTDIIALCGGLVGIYFVEKVRKLI